MKILFSICNNHAMYYDMRCIITMCRVQSWGLWSHFGLGGLGGLVGLVGLGGEGGLVGSDWVWK